MVYFLLRRIEGRKKVVWFVGEWKLNLVENHNWNHEKKKKASYVDELNDSFWKSLSLQGYSNNDRIKGKVDKDMMVVYIRIW